MKKISLLTLLVLFFYSAFSEDLILSGVQATTKISGAKLIRYTDESPLPNYIGFDNGQNLTLSQFDKWFHGSFQLSNDYSFQLLNSLNDQIGYTHYRFQQLYKGVPIQGSMWLLHLKNNNIVSMNGTLYNKINLSNAPTITEAASLAIALAKINAQTYKWENVLEEQNLKIRENNPQATYYPKGKLVIVKQNGIYHLCYAFNIYAIKPLARSTEYVDAATGQIVMSENEIKTIGVTGTANTKYSGIQSIQTDSTAATNFRLRENTRGGGIFTYNCGTTTTYSATDFTDTNNNWNNINANQDEVATDAHWGAQKTYDFFNTTYGRNSIDNAGFALYSYVHYDVGLVNAFWDGQEMSYGDGDANRPPLTALDITGHEITHGLTTFTCNFNGPNEPGALNEGFSDIQGKSIEHWARPSNSNWQIGSDINLIIRDMANPNASQNPDTYQGTNWDFANQEVHQNSTVLSFWFYLLTIGGSGTNDINNAYSVTGQGYTKSNAIAFRDQTVYLFPTAQYSDARFYAILSAVDLYGPCSPEVQATTDAWYAVGVGGPYVAGVQASFNANSTFSCSSPFTVQFANLSNNTNVYSWDFGDGSPISNANLPSHTYNSPGSYNVTLIANGGSCGTDTLTLNNFIVINPNAACVNMPTTGTGATQTACSGVLFDAGGAANNYSDNNNSTITISPIGAQFVSINFLSFATEAGYDSVRIYDGSTTASTMIGHWSGNALPNGGAPITSSGPSITVNFYSDAGVVAAGFAMNWQCFSNIPPVAAFTADATNSCSGQIHFSDASTGVPTNWFWDFGDGFTATTQFPTHTYAANQQYTVSLKVTNSYGVDSTQQVNFITVNHPTPGPIGTGGSTCSSGQVSLSASPVTAGNTINWYATANSSTVLGTGNNFVTPSISSTTNFYAEEVIAGPIDSVGPANNTFGTGTNYTNNIDRYLIFDCTSPTTLVSVNVISGATGNRTIELRDNAGNVLQQAVVNIPNGTSTVTLNFAIPIGNSLQLGLLSGGTAHNLYRNNAGAVFPYSNGPISITGTNSGTPGYYYFFYNWKIQTSNCASIRTPVAATTGNISAYAYANGSTAICSNDSVQLNAVTGLNYSYQWYSNGNLINAATQPTYTTSSAANYTCTISSTGCASATTSPISVSTIVSPISAIIQPSTDSASRCLGVPFTMIAQAGSGYSYQWYRNGTITGTNLDTLVAVNGGGLFTNLYTVMVTGLNGCSSLSQPFTLLSYTAPNATITPAANQVICAGQSAPVLTANNGINYTYQWNESGNVISSAVSNSFTPTTSGTYSVTIDNTYCPASTSAAVNVNFSTLTASFTQVINTNGSVVFTDASSGTPITWNWNFGDTNNSTAQNPTHTYNTAGSYTVTLVVTDALGCSQTFTNTVVVDITGINDLANNASVQLFPIPAKNILTIQLSASNWNGKSIPVELYNSLGQLMQTNLLVKNNQTINVSGLAAGTYALRLMIPNHPITRSFIIE
jgi:Zn-dependent metalloprotease